jgi:hypothetical protein
MPRRNNSKSATQIGEDKVRIGVTRNAAGKITEMRREEF